MNFRNIRLITITLASVFVTSSLHAKDPLAATYEAHGGLANWQAQGTLAFDLHLQFGETQTRDHQEFDLVNRQGVASNMDYAVGFDGTELWQVQAGEIGTPFPPRFYLWTPFYSLGAPFVFADEGAIKTEMPPAEFEDREFRVVRVTFESGVGDAPDDVYHLYIDPETHRLRMMRYTVSYFAAGAGKPTDDLPESAILYQGWNKTNSGMELARSTTAYSWEDDHITGEPRATMRFHNLRFLEARPDPARFAAPPGATIVE